MQSAEILLDFWSSQWGPPHGGWDLHPLKIRTLSRRTIILLLKMCKNFIYIYVNLYFCLFVIFLLWNFGYLGPCVKAQDEGRQRPVPVEHPVGIGPAAVALPSLIEALEDRDLYSRLNAARDLAKLGPAAAPALPSLIEALGDRDEDVRRAVVEALGQIGRPAIPALAKSLGHVDETVRATAARALGGLGDGAEPAIPDLVRGLADRSDSVRQGVSAALMGLGDGAMPAIVEALGHSDAGVRRGAAAILAQTSRIGREDVPGLMGALHDEEARVRLLVIQALGGYFSSTLQNSLPVGFDPDFGRAMFEMTGDPDSEVRQVAANALLRVSLQQRPDVVSILIGALDDRDTAVRIRAINLLGLIPLSGMRGPELVLLTALKDSEAPVRAGAARTLGRSFGVEQIPALVVALGDPEPAVVAAAAAALIRHDPARVPILAAVETMDAKARRRAVEAIERAWRAGDGIPLQSDNRPKGMLPKPGGDRPVASSPPVVDAKGPALREHVGRYFDRLGPGAEAPASAEDWIRNLKVGDAPGRARAARELAGPGPVLANAMAALVEALGDPNPDVRREAASALDRIGARAIPSLLAAIIGHDDGGVRSRSLEILVRIPSRDDEETAAILARALHDSEPRVRVAAARALATTLSNDETVAALLEAADDGTASVRAESMRTLSRLTSVGQEVLRKLARALGDPEPDVREAATEALARLDEDFVVRQLAGALEHPDPRSRRGAAEIVAHTLCPEGLVPTLVGALGDPDDEILELVVAALHAIGQRKRITTDRFGVDSTVDLSRKPDLLAALSEPPPGSATGPRPILPALVTSLGDPDPDVRRDATSAIEAIGWPAVRSLGPALEHPDREVRLLAVELLGTRAYEVGWIPPGLISALRDDDPQVRARAASLLGEAEQAGIEAISALVEAIGDADPEVRRATVVALSGLGSPGVAALTRAMQDPDPTIRLAALRHGPVDSGTISILVEALADREIEVREAALSNLKDARRDPPQDRSTPTGLRAAVARAKIGRPIDRIGRSALPVLARLQEHPDAALRATSVDLLGRLDPPIGAEASLLVESLGDPDDAVRRAAASAIDRLGPAAATSLVDALTRSTPEVRVRVLERLTIQPLHDRESSGDLVAALIRNLRDDRPEIRRQAVLAIGRLHSLPAAVAALVMALDDPDPSVRGRAAYYLLSSGGPAAASKARARLVDGLRDVDKAWRLTAVERLGDLRDEEAVAVTPRLIEVLGDEGEDDSVREQAIESLRRIGRPAVPALEIAAREGKQTIRFQIQGLLSPWRPKRARGIDPLASAPPVVPAAVPAEALSGLDRRVAVDDDFGMKPRLDHVRNYRPGGGASLQPDGLELPEGGSITRPIAIGPIAEWTVDLDLPALEREGDASETWLTLVGARPTDLASVVLIGRRTAGEAGGEIHFVGRTEDLGRLALPRWPVGGTWKVGYRNGFLSIECDGRRLGPCFVFPGEPYADWGIKALMIEQRGGKALLRRFRLSAAPPPPEDQAHFLADLDELIGRLRNMSDSRRALAPAIRRCEISRELLGEVHPDHAFGLKQLAFVHMRMLNDHLALPLLKEAIAIHERAEGPTGRDYANLVLSLAEVYQALGDRRRAEPLYHQGVGMLAESHGEVSTDVQVYIKKIQYLYLIDKNYEGLERSIRGSNEAWAKLFGEESQLYVTGLLDLADALRLKGDHRLAEETRARAAELLARLKPTRDDPHVRVEFLRFLGDRYRMIGDDERAEECLRESLELARQVLGEENSSTAWVLNDLGLLHVARGDFRGAEPFYARALEVREKLLGPDHRTTRASLSSMMMTYEGLGDLRRASTYAREVVSAGLRQREEAFAEQSERQQLALLGQLRGYLDRYLGLAVRAEEPADSTYENLLAWKGVVFARQHQIREARSDPGLAPLFQELERTSAQLAGLVGSMPEAGGRAEWFRQIEALTDQREREEVEIARRAVERVRAGQGRVTVDALREALPEGVAIVDLLEYRHLPLEEYIAGMARASLLNPPEMRRSMVAHVIRPDRPVARVDLGPSGPIAEAVEAWRTATAARDEPAGRVVERSLRRLLAEPLEAHLDGMTTLLVSPDGPLMNFPLAALPAREPGRYWIEERAVAVVPVPNLLLALLTREGRSSAPEGGVGMLLVGDVDYEAAPGPARLAGALEASQSPPAITRGAALEFPPLPNTAFEVEEIRRLHQWRFPGAPSTLVGGPEATEDAVRRLAPAHSYVHLATHGFFTPPESPGPGERVGPSTALFTVARDVGEFHPDLMAGVVLAGARRASRHETDSLQVADDGILTALEAAALDLDGVELIVLSACETGLGHLVGGEGALSLQRAFQLAGARTTVTSLWKVDDAATRALMVAFYRNLWERKMGRLEALRQAQLDMIHGAKMSIEGVRGAGAVVRVDPAALEEARLRMHAGGRHAPPADWAAFVLGGDWR